MPGNLSLMHSSTISSPNASAATTGRTLRLDGYPRTLAQAAAFDAVLREQFLDLTAVILLTVDDEEILHRL